jgi:hypothetical protein
MIFWCLKNRIKSQKLKRCKVLTQKGKGSQKVVKLSKMNSKIKKLLQSDDSSKRWKFYSLKLGLFLNLKIGFLVKFLAYVIDYALIIINKSMHNMYNRIGLLF